MGSNETPPLQKLPFIDFSNLSPPTTELKPGSPYWDSLKTQVREALEEFGCFEASFDKIPGSLRSDGFGSLKELFDLPLSRKQGKVGETAYRGYLGQQAEYPLFESIGIHYPDSMEKVESFTNTLWPRGNPSFSKNMQSLSEKVAELDQIVRRMIVEGFGLEKYTSEHMNSTKYNLRLMKYGSPRTPDPTLGLKPHNDTNMITTLWQNRIDGLEIQTKKGEWLQFRPSSPNSFLVMVGDCLYVWLNGRVHCPNHRVMVCGNEPRYSFGLFTSPKPGYVIKAPEELIDEEEHPLLFKPFEYQEYLALAFKQAGSKEANTLRACFGL